MRGRKRRGKRETGGCGCSALRKAAKGGASPTEAGGGSKVAAITSGTSYNVVRYQGQGTGRPAGLESIPSRPRYTVQCYTDMEYRARYTLRPPDQILSGQLKNASDERLAGRSQRASNNWPGLVAGGPVPGSSCTRRDYYRITEYTSTHLGAARKVHETGDYKKTSPCIIHVLNHRVHSM